MGLADRLNHIKRVVRTTVIRKIIHFTRRIHPPFFEGVSLWEILFFFGYSIRRGYISTRASSLAFHFFLAMIPFGLIMVILSNSLHFFDLEHDIVPILASFIPEDLFNQFLDNVHQFENSRVNSVLSIGFVIALYFTSNGFTVMIRAFNHSKMKFQKRKWWSIRLTSFFLVVMFIMGVLSLFFVILSEKRFLNWWGKSNDWVNEHHDGLFMVLAFITAAVALYMAVATIYYLGPSKRKEFKFFSAGATLATILILLISEGYTLYIKYFAQFDELYGSIGTIMVLMLWIYLMSFALLIGFELNASIHGAINHKKLQNLKSIEDRYGETYL